METSCFSKKRALVIFTFFIIFMWSCAIPVPIAEQNFNQNLVGEEYAVFDLAAESIFIYQKEKKEKNEAFLLSLQKNSEGKSQNKTWYESAKTANETGSDLTSKIETIWRQIVYQSGGNDAKGHPLGSDQKLVAEKILFQRKQASELQLRISEAKQAWLNLIPSQDKSRIENAMPNFLKNENWVEENTKDLQIGVLQLSFAHLTFGVEKAKEEMLIYFWEKINSPPLVFDRFQVMSNPRKSFVKKGEIYETEIYLSPILNPFGDENMTAVINGQTFPFRDGVAKYKVTASSIGKRKINAQIKVKDPLTGDIKFYEKPFEYKVGEDAIHLSVSKMNVFYIGVDNPITISAPGVSFSNLKVTVSGGGGARIRKIGGEGNYNVTVTRPTRLGEEVKINLETNGFLRSLLFRVKQLPNPVAQLGNSQSGAMGVDQFKAQAGVLAILHNFDFDAKCKIQGFIISRIPIEGDRIEVINKGARYSVVGRKLIDEAIPGDIFTFDKVKARCPGDLAGRMVNSMVFKIK